MEVIEHAQTRLAPVIVFVFKMDGSLRIRF